MPGGTKENLRTADPFVKWSESVRILEEKKSMCHATIGKILPPDTTSEEVISVVG